MGYSIKAFQPIIDSGNPLVARSEVVCVNSGERLILLKDNQESLCPSLWRDCVKETFKNNKCLLNKTDWENLYEFSSARSLFFNKLDTYKNSFTEEQKYIFKVSFSHYKHASLSFAILGIENRYLRFSLLGDLVLFIYERAKNKMVAYSSMLGPSGTFDFSQPCHGLTSQINLIGSPISRKIPLSDALVFITTRDLANWIIESSSTDLSGTVGVLTSIGSQTDFDSIVNKIHSKQAYKSIPFNKEQICLGIIDFEKVGIVQRLQSVILKNKLLRYTLLGAFVVACLMTLIFLLISVFFKPR